jgi:membrane associated rhomboid family serine protease
MIGASGAIAGVIGAYLVMFPDRKVWVLLFVGIPVKISAVIVLGLWILTQVLSYSAGQYGDAEVAWMAHISGFFIGAVLIFVMRRHPAPGG